jgi:UDP-N-acetylmuramoylalanine--D-glutamate ligase
VRTFGLDGHDFGVRDGFLVEAGERLLAVKELPIHGAHNVANALAACALVRALGVPLEKLAEGLKSFRGLPHRLELVARRDGVEWFDDSKGTNVGATVAALRGLGKKVVLILGGEGKGQDFTPLRAPVREFAAQVLLIGRDAPLIAKAVGGERCISLEEAVNKASTVKAEAVLLSPACASFDMFRDYKHRGDAFAAAVRALPA